MTMHAFRMVFPALALILVTPTHRAGAQIGGLIRKKVVEAAGAPAAQPEPVQRKDPDVLEMTPPVLDRFERALRTEIRLRSEFRQYVATLTTPEQFRACQTQVALSPEAQKIAAQLGELPENATPEQFQVAMTKMTKEMADLLTQKCGPDPSQWNDNWKAMRLKEIRAQAVEGSAGDLSSSPGFSTISSLEDGGEPLAILPSQGSGMTVRQYELIIERLRAFCPAFKGAPASGSGQTRIPGSGQNIFFIYSETETRTLAPRCSTLMDLTMQVD